jgi:hypothetical protein
MATARPFAYNTGSAISGTTQVGSLAVGTPLSGFTSSPQFWNGPDEELGFVIAQPISGNTQPTPISGVTASVGFSRTSGFSDSEFVSMANTIANQSYTTALQASTGLTSLGYWNSWTGITNIEYITAVLQSSSTFNSFNIVGPGLILLGISSNYATDRSLVSVTINGVNAPILVSKSQRNVPNTRYVYTAFAALSLTGTSSTANVQLTWTTSGLSTNIVLSSWRISNNTSDTPIKTNNVGALSAIGVASIDLSLTAMVSGYKSIAALSTNSSGQLNIWTGTNLVENFDLNTGFVIGASGASPTGTITGTTYSIIDTFAGGTDSAAGCSIAFM